MKKYIVVLSLALILFVGLSCSDQENQNKADPTLKILPAYTIIQIADLENPDAYTEYTGAHLPAMTQYGGKFIAETHNPVKIEGNRPPGRFFLIQKWTELKSFNKWYRSGEYALIKKLQDKGFKINIGLLNSARLPAELASINAGLPSPQAVYVIYEVLSIKDQYRYRKYFDGWLQSIKNQKGRILARDNSIETLVGKFSATEDFILAEWPDLDSFYAWYDSEQMKPLRQVLPEISDFNMYLINSADMRPELVW